MNTGEIDNRIREIVTPVPTDAEAPRMYLHTVYILGALALATVVGIIGLSAFDKPVDAGLVAIASAAAGYIGGLLSRNA